MYIWVLRAIRAEKSVGKAIASSSALVCSDCVWPNAAAIASIQVRAILLNGSCSVRDHPDVCEWVRNAIDFGSFGLNCFTILAQSIRAARILAISIKWFIPIAQKNDRRGAKASISRPDLMPVRRYSRPSAKVYASSMSAVAPASCMWYPEILILLNLGIFFDEYSKISPMIRILISGG